MTEAQMRELERRKALLETWVAFGTEEEDEHRELDALSAAIKVLRNIAHIV